MSIPECNSVLLIKGPNGGVCVGYTVKAPPGLPSYDGIHICLVKPEDITGKPVKIEEKTFSPNTCKLKIKCRSLRVFSLTELEAVHLGLSLIQAASFRAKEREKKEWGDIQDKIELIKKVE